MSDIPLRDRYNIVLQELTDKTMFLKGGDNGFIREDRRVCRFKGTLSSYWFYSIKDNDLFQNQKKYKKWLDDLNKIVENMLIHFEYCPPSDGYLKAQSSYQHLRKSVEDRG